MCIRDSTWAQQENTGDREVVDTDELERLYKQRSAQIIKLVDEQLAANDNALTEAATNAILEQATAEEQRRGAVLLAIRDGQPVSRRMQNLMDAYRKLNRELTTRNIENDVILETLKQQRKWQELFARLKVEREHIASLEHQLAKSRRNADNQLAAAVRELNAFKAAAVRELNAFRADAAQKSQATEARFAEYERDMNERQKTLAAALNKSHCLTISLAIDNLESSDDAAIQLRAAEAIDGLLAERALAAILIKEQKWLERLEKLPANSDPKVANVVQSAISKMQNELKRNDEINEDPFGGPIEDGSPFDFDSKKGNDK